MSFLLRRNLPRSWGGFNDSFDTYGVTGIVPPWVHIGDGTPADFNASGELHIPQNYLTVNGGGESYEFMPFTPNWGWEAEIWNPVTGLAAQSFSFYMTDSWTTVAPGSFKDVVGILVRHAPAAGGDTIQYAEFANTFATAVNAQQWTSPVTFNGNTLTIRCWVDNDEYVRVWLNGTYLGMKQTSPTYKFGPRRRCNRFLNNNLNDVWMRYYRCFDRTSDMPSPALLWTSTFYDNYNRANGPVANGWTEYGSNAQARIVNNSYAWNDTNDGTRAVMRDTGRTDGRQRIEAVVGGNANPSGQAQHLLVRSNVGGTSAIIATVLNNTITLNRLTGSIAVTTPAVTQLATASMTISSGNTIALSARDNWAWVEVNGTTVLRAFNIDSMAPVAQAYSGAAVHRNAFTNSGSWNDTRLLVPV